MPRALVMFLSLLLGIKPRFAIYVQNHTDKFQYDLQKDTITEDPDELIEQIKAMREEGIDAGVVINLMFDNGDFPDCVEKHKPHEKYQEDEETKTSLN
jgi:hypothetical protein